MFFRKINYFPAILIPFTSTEGDPHLCALSANGLNFKSSPTEDMSFISCKKLPEIVIPFTGVVF